MKQQIAASLAGLLLLTSGYENAGGKPLLGLFKHHPQSKKTDKTAAQEADEKNIHGQWQGKSNPTLYDGGFFARADVLYWRADEEGLQYGEISTVAPSIPKAKSKIALPSIKWDPGFRVGIGYTFSKQDYWSLMALWTHFQTHQSHSNRAHFTFNQSVNGEAIIPWWGASVLGSFAQKGSVHWNLTYNVYDLDLGRDYFISKTFSVHPFMGLRGAAIGQKYHAEYEVPIPPGLTTTVNTSFKAKNDFWGIGAHAGTALQWYCTSSFSLIGNIGGALLYADYKIKEHLNAFTAFNGILEEAPLSSHDHHTSGAVNLEALLGFQWEKFFYQNKYRLAISAGYEWSQWFSQNQMFRSDSFTTSASPFSQANIASQEKGDLRLQGANFQLRVDF